MMRPGVLLFKRPLMRPQTLVRTASASCLAAVLAGSLTWVQAQQPGAAIALDPDDIGGVVTGPKGPEGGVWVVAETTDTPTRFARIVVTDDQGRYVVPDLPRGTYQVFARGYGLVDSQRQAAKPGQRMNITVQAAPDARAAAQVYPAAWWLSMLEIPPGKFSQKEVADQVRNCLNCHQLGGKATREILPAITAKAKDSLEAWDHRTQMGPVGQNMGASFVRLGEQRRMFADWTDRIA